MRRFYVEPQYTHETTTTDIEPVGSQMIANMDSVVIVPVGIQSGHTADLIVEVSYDEPKYNAEGEFDATEDADFRDNNIFQWRAYKTVRFVEGNVPDDNKVVISPLNTGITAVRLSVKAVAGDHSLIRIYFRGYFIER